jgi:hypothetical protein
MQDHISKITKAKRAGGMAECPGHMLQVPSPNTSTDEGREKGERKGEREGGREEGDSIEVIHIFNEVCKIC